jgi:RNA polymerase sigma factor (TIGR02999 family)
MSTPTEVTELLAAVAAGDDGARETLFERVYDQLKRVARGQMRRSGEWLPINPTTLLHEAWIKLDRADLRPLEGSQHFYNVFGQAMRQILVDLARSHGSARRGGGLAHTDLTERIEQPDKSADDLLAVDAALGKLETCDAELAQLVEWHFFAGISFVDIAKARGVTERTVRRHWDLARIFLSDAIGAASVSA